MPKRSQFLRTFVCLIGIAMAIDLERLASALDGADSPQVTSVALKQPSAKKKTTSKKKKSSKNSSKKRTTRSSKKSKSAKSASKKSKSRKLKSKRSAADALKKELGPPLDEVPDVPRLPLFKP